MYQVTALRQAIPDSLSSPLPGGISAVVRFFFQVPQWLQISGAIAAVLVAIAVVVVLWRRRAPIIDWFRTRPKLVWAGMIAGVAVLAVAGAAFGFASWHYMQHDNGFCTGCHVMGPAFQKFSNSEHAQLECHDCHQQPITASMRQLYLWVLERPEEIGPHAPVRDAVCARCHIQEDPDSTWQRIIATTGHKLHLESDSAPLRQVMCVTCHGRDVHRFLPPRETCGQSGCHEPVDTRIRLGAMADQTGMHCVACHNFTAQLPTAAPVDSLTQRMVPTRPQCFGCHNMQNLMNAFDAEQDPHQGQCGLCHNPHVQTVPGRSWTTCATSGCHMRVDTLTPFHRGLHAGVLEKCSTCHVAHTWQVRGMDCRSCHRVLR
jgi:hypothetical protein